MLFHALLQVGAAAAVVWMTQSIILAVAGMTVTATAVLICYTIPSTARGSMNLSGRHSTFNIGALSRLMWLGAPMGIVMGVNTVIGAMPRYFLAANAGPASVAVFTGMFQLTLIGAQLSTAMTDAATPRLATKFLEGDTRAFWISVAGIAAGAAGIGAVGFFVTVLVGRAALAAIYRPEYATEIGALTWIMASCPFQYVGGVLGVAVTAMRRFHIQVPLRLVHLAATYWLCKSLVESDGLNGAGQAVFASALLLAVATGFVALFCASRNSVTPRRRPEESLQCAV
jgi:O-antigen/teichoic acid export membrane protein